jgi:hypothetical protein
MYTVSKVLKGQFKDIKYTKVWSDIFECLRLLARLYFYLHAMDIQVKSVAHFQLQVYPVQSYNTYTSILN